MPATATVSALPLLERAYNPKIKHGLLQLANLSRWDYHYLRTAAMRQWKRVAKINGTSGAIRLSVAAFRRQPNALQRQLLRQAVETLRGSLGQFEFRHWGEVERLFTERPVGTVVDLPGGLQLIRERDVVVCRCAASAKLSLG